MYVNFNLALGGIMLKRLGSRRSSALTKKQYDYIVESFLQKDDFRMAIITMLLFQCVRVGDVIKTLKIEDIYTSFGEVRERIRFNEQKTGKSKTILSGKPGSRLNRALSIYYKKIEHLPRYCPMFYNYQGFPITDDGVGFLLRKFVGKMEIEQCSAHSFRKAGAKYLHSKGIDIEVISQILNHYSVSTTRVYLDVKEKEVEKCMEMLVF